MGRRIQRQQMVAELKAPLQIIRAAGRQHKRLRAAGKLCQMRGALLRRECSQMGRVAIIPAECACRIGARRPVDPAVEFAKPGPVRQIVRQLDPGGNIIHRQALIHQGGRLAHDVNDGITGGCQHRADVISADNRARMAGRQDLCFKVGKHAECCGPGAEIPVGRAANGVEIGKGMVPIVAAEEHAGPGQKDHHVIGCFAGRHDQARRHAVQIDIAVGRNALGRRQIAGAQPLHRAIARQPSEIRSSSLRPMPNCAWVRRPSALLGAMVAMSTPTRSELKLLLARIGTLPSGAKTLAPEI